MCSKRWTTEELLCSQQDYSRWVMVLKASVQWRVIAFGAPNLFGISHSLSSHRVVC